MRGGETRTAEAADYLVDSSDDDDAYGGAPPTAEAAETRDGAADDDVLRRRACDVAAQGGERCAGDSTCGVNVCAVEAADYPDAGARGCNACTEEAAGGTDGSAGDNARRNVMHAVKART